MFPPGVSLLKTIESQTGHGTAAASVRNLQSQSMLTIQQDPILRRPRRALQVGNNHDRKLQTLCLVNSHQLHGVGGLIYLALAFAAADGLEFLNITHEIANQVGAGTFKALRQCEEPLHVRQTLSAVEGSCDDCGKL